MGERPHLPGVSIEDRALGSVDGAPIMSLSLVYSAIGDGSDDELSRAPMGGRLSGEEVVSWKNTLQMPINAYWLLHLILPNGLGII